MVALLSLAVGAVLDVALGPHKGKHTGETALFRQLHHLLHDGDVLLADRYFCGYFHLALVLCHAWIDGWDGLLAPPT